MLRSRILALVLVLVSPLVAQTALRSPLQVEGTPGQFVVSFDVSAPCPVSTTSSPGSGLICGHNGALLVSLNGRHPFLLEPGQPGPKGDQGPPGASATVKIGKVTSGVIASVTNSGTDTDGILNFVIPRAQGLVIPVDYPLVGFSGDVGSKYRWRMPSVIAEIYDEPSRVQADLSHATMARIFVQVGPSGVGPVGANLFCQYSVDNEKSWFSLTTPAAVDSAGAHVSKWTSIPSKARSDVVVRAVGRLGSGSEVDIRSVHLQVQ